MYNILFTVWNKNIFIIKNKYELVQLLGWKKIRETVQCRINILVDLYKNSEANLEEYYQDLSFIVANNKTENLNKNCLIARYFLLIGSCTK